jgi:hypothetical protein
VVVIVLLVVHLTKAGANSGATGGSTATTSAPAAAPAATYEFTAPAKAGPYAYNSAATRIFAGDIKSVVSSVAAQIKAKGAGTPGKDVIAVYDLSSITTPGASGFKAVNFTGYDGTFKPAAIIAAERAQLIDTRMVPAGPHGGEMMCGYSVVDGSDTSECVWATTSTFGQVEFVIGTSAVKYLGASSIALTVRNAVEVQAAS